MEEIIKQEIAPYLKKVCFCWSWANYKSCCKWRRIKRHIRNDFFQNAVKTSFRAWKVPLKLIGEISKKVEARNCLNWCEKDAINSHLISKNIIKKTFTNPEHVFVISPIEQEIDEGRYFDFKKIGIQKVKVLKCWCSECDNHIFEEIDNNIIDIHNESHLFLYFLRSSGFELRLKQNQLRLNLEILFLKPNDFEPLFSVFLSTYLGYLDIHLRYSRAYKLYVNKKFNKVCHKIFEVSKHEIFVATSTQLSKDLKGNIVTDLDNPNQDGCPFVLNIISSLEKTYVIFSVMTKDLHTYKCFFDQLGNIYNSDIFLFKKVVNNIIFSHSENIILWDWYVFPDNFNFNTFYDTNLDKIDYLKDENFFEFIK